MLEFVILVAILFSLIAFGTDAMLPALPAIAADLGVGNVNQAQLVISAFVLGTGLGQLFMGPLSDTYGRKPLISFGILIFIAACVMAYYAQSLGWMLVARFIQGIGISAPRTVTMAMVRDQYSGRMMAKVMSIAMAIFVLVPAVAPYLGQVLYLNFGWRSIYLAFILFALIGLAWMTLRQPETLAVADRRKLKSAAYYEAFLEVIRSRTVMIYTAVLALGYGALFGYLNSAQQVYVDTLKAGTMFPLYFSGVALLSGGAGFLNAGLVMRFGMRRLAAIAIGIQMLASAIFAVILVFGLVPLGAELLAFVIWSTIVFFMLGLIFGNLNALAMEPMGHIAGMASAIIGASATLFGIAIAVPIGLAFDGTALPLIIGFTLSTFLGFVLMLIDPKEKAVSDVQA